MITHIFDRQDCLTISQDLVCAIVEQVLKEEERTCDEVSLYFVDTAEICALHADFFDDPSTTDCISFPMDDDDDSPYSILGEVFVCPATAIAYASENKLDPYEETTLYIVHGLLHLMGYDDIDDRDAVLMRQAERRHMQKLKDLNLLLQTPTRS